MTGIPVRYPTIRIVKDLHVLFTGTNGHKTIGITVESVVPPDPRSGYAAKWDINDWTLMNGDENDFAEAFTMSVDDWRELKRRCKEMHNQLNPNDPLT